MLANHHGSADTFTANQRALIESCKSSTVSNAQTLHTLTVNLNSGAVPSARDHNGSAVPYARALRT